MGIVCCIGLCKQGLICVCVCARTFSVCVCQSSCQHCQSVRLCEGNACPAVGPPALLAPCALVPAVAVIYTPLRSRTRGIYWLPTHSVSPAHLPVSSSVVESCGLL